MTISLFIFILITNFHLFKDGRRGQLKETMEYDCIDSGRDGTPEKVKNETLSMIMDEFARRRKSFDVRRENAKEPNSRTARVKHSASSGVKIRHLTTETRNKYLDAINDLLKKNVESCAVVGVYPTYKLKNIDYENIAARLEYELIFTKSSSMPTYKHSFASFRKNIKSMGACLYPAILDYLPETHNDYGDSFNGLKRKTNELNVSSLIDDYVTTKISSSKRFKSDSMKQTRIDAYYRSSGGSVNNCPVPMVEWEPMYDCAVDTDFEKQLVNDSNNDHSQFGVNMDENNSQDTVINENIPVKTELLEKEEATALSCVTTNFEEDSQDTIINENTPVKTEMPMDDRAQHVRVKKEEVISDAETGNIWLSLFFLCDGSLVMHG